MAETMLSAQLARLQARWYAGGNRPLPATDIPAGWSLPEADDARRLALLAMGGQCQQFLMLPAAPANLSPAAAFPALPLATLEAPERMLSRRLLPRLRAEQVAALMRMLAARRRMLHPFDVSARHFPADVDLPGCYDAWRAWYERQARAATPDATVPADDDWSLMTPGEQRRHLQALRAQDPAQGREAFAAHAAALPAPQRLALLEVLAERLQADDLPALEALHNDRSEKVRQRAAQLRARLGADAPAEAALLAELPQWFELGRSGLLRRRTEAGFAPLKNAAQRRQREELLAQATWEQIAAALGVPSLELVEHWRWRKDDEAHGLLACVARSAPLPVVQAWLEKLLFAPATEAVWSLPPLYQRLDDAQRQALALRGLPAADTCLTTFDALLDLAGGPLPALEPGQLLASRPWRELHRQVVVLEAAALDGLADELLALACLVPGDCARACLALLDADGARAAEPALDPLRLNARTLPPSPSEEPHP